jgi:multiple sugar transport system permease protein
MPLSAGLATLAGRITTDYPVMMAARVLALTPVLILFIESNRIESQRCVVVGLVIRGSQ